jgi:uridine kinase
VNRPELLAALAEHVLSVSRPHPTRVAIDGCSAAGKTTLADELADILAARTRRHIIRVGIDYFKRARVLRTAYPPDSPDSYYLDSWDNDAILAHLLLPLGPSGNRLYRTAVMNLAATEYLDAPYQAADFDAILVADGCFLQRPELDPHWDLRIFIHVSFETVLRRGIERDQAWMESAAAAEHRYRTKYIPGEQRYLADVDPAARAQIVVDNTDFANPLLYGTHRSQSSTPAGEPPPPSGLRPPRRRLDANPANRW